MNLWEFIELLENQRRTREPAVSLKQIEVKEASESKKGLCCGKCLLTFNSLSLYRDHFRNHTHKDTVELVQNLGSDAEEFITLQKSPSSSSSLFILTELNLQVEVNSILVSCFCQSNPLTVDTFMSGARLFSCKRYWSVFLYRSGSYASGIFDVINRKFCHTYHSSRYTIRKKSGFSQNKCDKSKTIHSAGSSIRREQFNKLMEDIRNNVQKWSSYIKSSSLIVWMPNCNIQGIFTECLEEDFKRFSAVNFQIDDINLDALDKCVDLLTDTPCRTWKRIGQ